MGGKAPHRIAVADARAVTADADANIAWIDTEIVALNAKRAFWLAEKKRVKAYLPKVRTPSPEMVLACEDCTHGRFPVGTALTALLSHTMERHGRRPTKAERTPVPTA